MNNPDRMRKPHKLLLLITALVACMATLTYAFLFRDVERTYPLGQIVLDFEWGKVQRVRIDFNQDGLVDFKGEYYEPIRDPSDHDPFYRRWESSRCDGFFDIFIQYDLGGEIVNLRFDGDQDGEFDIEKNGKEGETFLLEVVRESCANWYPDMEDPPQE